MKRTFALLIFFIYSINIVLPQKEQDFRFWEDSLIQLRDKTIYSLSELERYQANEDFMNTLEMVLNKKNVTKFSWSEVKNFSIIESPDQKFKLFTWNVQRKDYSYENFGFLHAYNERRKKYVLYPLYDKRLSIDYPQTFVGNHNLWYGATYYQIVPLKAKNRTYYTLLGYNANDIFTHQKIIEVLFFKPDGTPVFGAYIFKKYPQKVTRVIFDYSKNSTFSLKYEKHSFDVRTGKRDPKTKKMIYKTIFSPMIIFEKLIPMEEGLEGIAAFMVPESSLNQGFIEDNGKWLFLPSVKGRNPDKKMPKYMRKNRSFHSKRE